MLQIPVLSIHDLSTVRSGYGPLMKVSARSAGGQVCILHLARFNDFPGTKIVAIEPVQKTKPREKMVYFSLTAKLEWLTLVRPAATARAHSRSRNAFGEKTLTSCLTRVGGPEIGWGVRQEHEGENLDDGYTYTLGGNYYNVLQIKPLNSWFWYNWSSSSTGASSCLAAAPSLLL